MIEYLEKLLDEGKHERALAYAEQLLLNADISPLEVLAAQVALLRIRAGQNQWEQAVGPGRVAMQLAGQLAQWDYYGTASFYLSGVLGVLQQPEEAIQLLLGYLEHLPYYRGARTYELWAWFHLGRCYSDVGESRLSLRALTRALQVAAATQDEWAAHRVRQAVIEQHLRSGRIGVAARLLAACSHYLRHHRAEAGSHRSWLFHLKLRVEYALITGRLDRARAIAVRGLSESGRDLPHQSSFHLLLAKVFHAKGGVTEAMGHLAAARALARLGNLVDIETEASALAYEMAMATSQRHADLDRDCLVVS